MPTMKERENDFVRRIQVYGCRREVKTMLVEMSKVAYEAGYKDAATEVRDIVWPSNNLTDKQNSWLSDLVDLIDDMVVEKGFKPLEKSQYDTPAEPDEDFRNEEKPEPEKCASCRSIDIRIDKEGKKFCAECGRSR